MDLMLTVDLPYVPAQGTQVTITEPNDKSPVPGERIDHNFVVVHQKLTLAPKEGTAKIALLLMQV